MKKLILVLMAMCLVSVASASTVWNPAANGITPPAVGNWNDPCNWTNGIPTSLEKAVFNVPDAAECQVSDAQSGAQVVQGDGNVGGTLRIVSGGSLTTKAGAWSAVGYNNTAHAIVDDGGIYNFSQHAWIGLLSGAVGTLDVSGDVNVSGMLGVGWNGGTGTLNILDGGELNLQQLHAEGNSVGASSVVNFSGSAIMTKTSNFVGVAETYIDSGQFAALTPGVLAASYDSGTDLTTIQIVPEPATMILLGLGGLLIRRKK